MYFRTLAFIGLNGTASYDPRIASGGFAGNCSGGQCTGCIAFAPFSSSLGPANCVLGDATRVMPGIGKAVFAPAGGSLTNTTGNAAVNFATRA